MQDQLSGGSLQCWWNEEHFLRRLFQEVLLLPFLFSSHSNLCEFRKFASSCSVCKLPILPKRGETVAARLRALGRDFHPECFKCEVLFPFTLKSKTSKDIFKIRIATKILTRKSLDLSATLWTTNLTVLIAVMSESDKMIMIRYVQWRNFSS